MAQGPEGREDGELGALGLQTGGRVEERQGWGMWRLKANKETLGLARRCSQLWADGHARAPSERDLGSGPFHTGP